MGVDWFKETPFGNTFTLDFTKAAIINEKLGKGADTDFLTVSFSSTDYVGHRYGVEAIETQDTYLRLDKDLEDFLTFLDSEVGKDNYTLFLTADHAAVQVPAYLESLKVPAGYFNNSKFREFLNQITKEYFNAEGLVENVSNHQIFLDRAKIKAHKISIDKLIDRLVSEIIHFEGVYKVVSAKTMNNTHFTSGILQLLQNGYNQKISGDVLVIPNPSYIIRSRTGTTHGSGYAYDTHVPIIFYGKGIKKGENSKRYVPIVDIAPTISNLLGISFPNGTTGKIIPEIFDR